MPPHLGLRANRSTATEHFDDDMIALAEREKEEIDAERQEELEAIAEIAALTDHPGYQKMRTARMTTIEHYRSGAFVEAAMVDPEITNEKLGELVRVGTLVAKELEKELLTVESAAQAVEEEKSVKRQRRQTGNN